MTKFRWTAEEIHGVLKQKYRLLDYVIDNKLLPKVGLSFKIAAFLHNQFGKTLESDREFSDQIVQNIKTKNM